VVQGDSGREFEDTLHALSLQAVNACLSRSGFGEQADTYISALENYQSDRYQALPGYTQQWSIDLINVHAVAQTGMLVQVMTGENSPPSTSSLSAGEVRAVNADSTRCISQARQPARKFQRDGSALERLWYTATESTYRSSAVNQADRAFGSCVMRQGTPPAATGSPEQFQTWLDPVVNPPGWTSGTLPSGPRAALDAHWSAAWASCAGPVVSVMQRLLLAAQKLFLQAHYQQVTTLEQLVGGSVSQMQRMSELG
jgi:hypothetical protein